jgi:hypothetical protein
MMTQRARSDGAVYDAEVWIQEADFTALPRSRWHASDASLTTATAGADPFLASSGFAPSLDQRLTSFTVRG